MRSTVRLLHIYLLCIFQARTTPHGPAPNYGSINQLSPPSTQRSSGNSARSTAAVEDHDSVPLLGPVRAEGNDSSDDEFFTPTRLLTEKL